MTYPINLKDIDCNIEFYPEVITLYKEAENYLRNFYWCKQIQDCYLYTNIGSAFGIFLFKIINTSSPEDDFLWVIAGDIPFMYLDVSITDTTVGIIERYVDLAEDWVAHIKSGLSMDDCYPFDAKPTIELAELLEARINFMKDSLIPNMEKLTLEISKR